MNQRNWLDLARKLVDQFDMDYTTASMQVALGQYALAFFGEGVLVTTQFPNPFPITMSGSVLGGSVGDGSGFDVNGQLTQITPSTQGSPNFVIPAADPSHPRWDLLVIDFNQLGSVPVPKPSDPITTIDLNLTDDFLLHVRVGTPSGSPAYPAKLANDIILAGLQVPAGATLGTSVFVDLSQREVALPDVAKLPVFINEIPTGTVNGTNKIFTLSGTPQTPGSLMIFVDSIYRPPGDYSLAGNIVTFTTAPAPGQSVEAWYIEDSPHSQNPLSGVQESLGNGDGTTSLFNLTGNPSGQSSVIVYVDGAKELDSHWQLISGATHGAIQFLSGSIPAAGQSIDVFYFVNALGLGPGGSGLQSVTNDGSGVGLGSVSGTTVHIKTLIAGANITLTDMGASGIGISATSGGGGGAPEVHGTFASPIVINPTIGITPTSAIDQIWYVVPNVAGAQLISSTPAIGPGTAIGDRLTLKGVSSANYLIVPDQVSAPGSGTNQNGPCSLTDNQSIIYTWDGSNWNEDTRRA